MGNFQIELYDTIVPNTVNNFLSLVDSKYYDNTIFHRVIDNFMIQGGDPTGTGSGGPGYKIDDEFDVRLSNIQKTLSMANSGPNTGGSQFFINLKNNTYLDFNKAPLSSKHAVFGIVIDSFEVVQRIGKVITDSKDRPVSDVIIDSIRRLPILCACPSYIDSKGLTIYPNPLGEVSHLIFNADTTANYTVQCVDAHGKTVLNQEFLLNKGYVYLEFKELNRNVLAPGLYSIFIIMDNRRLWYTKFVAP